MSRIKDSEAAGKHKARTDVVIEKVLNELGGTEATAHSPGKSRPTTLLSKVLNDSVKIITRAAKLLLEAKEKATSGQRMEAEKCRLEAHASLRNRSR